MLTDAVRREGGKNREGGQSGEREVEGFKDSILIALEMEEWVLSQRM